VAIAILTAFYASTQSWNFYANKALKQEKWDIVSTFRVPLEPEEAEKSWKKEWISNVRPFVSELGTVTAPTFTRDFVLQSAGDFRKIVELEFTEGKYFSSDHAFEVIFSKVDHLALKTGDYVKIKAGTNSANFRVVGILNRMTTGIAYFPRETGKKFVTKKIRGFHANTSLSATEIKKRLYQDENIAWVQPKTDIKVAVLDFLAQAMVVTQISLWISIGMAMLFLLTGITINIRDREGEYATLASLGYSDGFLTKVIIIETMIEGVIGLLVSIPLAFLFAKYLNYETSKAWFKMDLYFGAKEFVEVIIYAFLFLPVAAIPGIRHILTMDIPMAVRRKSFG